jgi:hypothetical protein
MLVLFVVQGSSEAKEYGRNDWIFADLVVSSYLVFLFCLQTYLAAIDLSARTAPKAERGSFSQI